MRLICGIEMLEIRKWAKTEGTDEDVEGNPPLVKRIPASLMELVCTIVWAFRDKTSLGGAI